MPSSPAPSDDEGDPGKPGRRRFGATGLKYTTTIMGPSRVGAMGLRVNGKRASAASKGSYRFSIKSATEVGPSVPAGEKSAMESTQDVSAVSPTKRDAGLDVPTNGNGANGGIGVSLTNSEMTAVAEDHKEQKELPKEPPKTISPEFHPRFKGAAEMEARRRERMRARAQPLAAVRPPPPPPYLNPELSSSSESESEDVDEDIPEDEDEDDFDMVPEADDDMDGDESDAYVHLYKSH